MPIYVSLQILDKHSLKMISNKVIATVNTH